MIDYKYMYVSYIIYLVLFSIVIILFIVVIQCTIHHSKTLWADDGTKEKLQ